MLNMIKVFAVDWVWFVLHLYPLYPIFNFLIYWYFSFLGIERDAVNIFTKYISPDAARPIPITEQIRNDIVGKKIPYHNDLSV